MEDFKKLTPEQQKNLENTEKTLEEQVSFEELKKQFEQEMQKELQDFQAEDVKVDQIVESVGLENFEMVEQVKNELQINEQLQELNSGAEELKERAEEVRFDEREEFNMEIIVGDFLKSTNLSEENNTFEKVKKILQNQEQRKLFFELLRNSISYQNTTYSQSEILVGNLKHIEASEYEMKFIGGKIFMEEWGNVTPFHGFSLKIAREVFSDLFEVNFSNKDIIDLFPSKEYFIRDWIRKASLERLQEIESIYNDPEIQNLPDLLNPEIQKSFIDHYRDSLVGSTGLPSENGEKLSFLIEKINKSEDLYDVESSAFEEVKQNFNLNELYFLYQNLQQVHPGSEVIHQIKDFIKSNVDRFASSFNNIRKLIEIIPIDDLNIEGDKLLVVILDKLNRSEDDNQLLRDHFNNLDKKEWQKEVDRIFNIQNSVGSLSLSIEKIISLTEQQVESWEKMNSYLYNTNINQKSGFVKKFENIEEDFWETEIERMKKRGEIKNNNIDSAFKLKDSPESFPESIQEKIVSFREKYDKKGEKLISLATVAYGIEDEEKFARKLESIEKILNLYHPENIPGGCKATMGIEYEVGNSIDGEYFADSFNNYATDMNRISDVADIKKGNDAVWEIATRPTENPYLLITEIKLLQDAGMLDFNFERYQNAARGFHMSLGGESGLRSNSPNMYFLENILSMSGNTGLQLGREISNLKGIYSKDLEDAGVSKVGSRVEFKGMGGDSFEQFERTIITSHNVAIATQLEQKYTEQQPETEQEKQILAEYQKLKLSIESAVKLHNRSFLEMEFNGGYFDENDEYHELDVEATASRRERYFGVENPNFKEEQKKYLVQENIFAPLSLQTVNGLTRANNLITFKAPILPGEYFATSKVLKDEYRGNSKMFLDTMKSKDGGILSGSPKDSLFERNGEMRDGYYALQGVSPEMLTHKVQILMNKFNNAMNQLINHPDSSLLVKNKSQYETI